MLAEDPIRGGEDVFYFQPGYRYLVFLGRLIVGDGDAALGVVQVIAFCTTALLLAAAVMRYSPDLPTRLLSGAFAATVMVFASSDYLVERAVQGLSEIPTWIAVLAFGVLMLHESARFRSYAVAVIAGLVITVRPNQGIAMVIVTLTAAALLLRDRPERWRWIGLGSGAVLMGIALLPLVHNLMYGGAFEPSSTNSPLARDLPLGDIAQFWRDAQVRKVLTEKTQGLLNVGAANPDVKFSTLSPILGFQTLWLASLVLLSTRRQWAPRHLTTWLIALWPFTYAAPHYVYDVWNYYPRHIVAFNLGLATSGLVLLGLRASTRHSKPGNATNEHCAPQLVTN